MNVYDFDGTLYAGDSTADFFMFCIRKNPSVLKALPTQVAGAARYALGRCDKTEMKQYFYTFLRYVPDIDQTVDLFWHEKGFGKLKSFCADLCEKNDAVASASPEFLLKPAVRLLGIRHLIASQVDRKTGNCLSANCSGAEKVRRFKEIFPNEKVDSFYTDDVKADAPFVQYSQQSYKVSGEQICFLPKRENDST